MKFTFFSKVKKWKPLYGVLLIAVLFFGATLVYATSTRCNGTNTQVAGHLWDCYRVNQGQTVRVGDPAAPIAEWGNCRDVTNNVTNPPPGTVGIFIPTNKAAEWQRLWDPTSRPNPLPSGLSLSPCNGVPGNYTLSVTTSGNGSGSVTGVSGGTNTINCTSGNFGACQQTSPAGTTVTLTASPASGSTFGGWSGGGCSGTGTCTITINSNVTVNAVFNAAAGNYTLSVTTSGNGSGSVTGVSGGTNTINCTSGNFGACQQTSPAGTTVTLTASPASGSTFGGWSGGGCSGTGTCTITINSNVTVNAAFTLVGGGDPYETATGAVGIYNSPQYCFGNASDAFASSIGRIIQPTNSTIWTPIRQDIAGISSWSANTKANANAVVDQLLPTFSNGNIVNGTYWAGAPSGGDRSGSITVHVNGQTQTFDWDTNVYNEAPTDACTSLHPPAPPNQASALMHLYGPY